MTAGTRARVLAGAVLIAALAGCGVISPPAQTAGPAGQGAPGPSPGAAPSSSLPYDMSGLLHPAGG